MTYDIIKAKQKKIAELEEELATRVQELKLDLLNYRVESTLRVLEIALKKAESSEIDTMVKFCIDRLSGKIDGIEVDNNAKIH